jgi:hypothetical protein
MKSHQMRTAKNAPKKPRIARFRRCLQFQTTNRIEPIPKTHAAPVLKRSPGRFEKEIATLAHRVRTSMKSKRARVRLPRTIRPGIDSEDW